MSLPGILFYGNCQARAFAGAFRQLPFITDRFAVYNVASFDMAQGNPARHMAQIPAASIVLLLEQLDVALPSPAWLTDALPQDVRRLRFVPLDTNLLWPLRVKDPRNRREPGYDFGRYPYGDRLVVELLARGLTGAEALAAYMAESPLRLPNMERLAAMEARRLQAREAEADIKVADIVMGQMPLQPLFWTFNHPSGHLFRQVGARMLEGAQATLGLSLAASAPQEHWAAFEPLAGQQIPIHPEVARQLKLQWWRPDQTYRSLDGSLLTFETYMRRYIDFA